MSQFSSIPTLKCLQGYIDIYMRYDITEVFVSICEVIGIVVYFYLYTGIVVYFYLYTLCRRALYIYDF